MYAKRDISYPLDYAKTLVGIVAIWAYKNNVALQIILVAVYGILFIYSYKLIKAIKPEQIKQQVVRV